MFSYGGSVVKGFCRFFTRVFSHRIAECCLLANSKKPAHRGHPKVIVGFTMGKEQKLQSIEFKLVFQCRNMFRLLFKDGQQSKIICETIDSRKSNGKAYAKNLSSSGG